MDGEAQEQISQRQCGCLIPGQVQGQAGWGPEQPALEEGFCPWQGSQNLVMFKAPSNPNHLFSITLFKTAMICVTGEEY